jgi:hypothetical protein
MGTGPWQQACWYAPGPAFNSLVLKAHAFLHNIIMIFQVTQKHQ